MRFTSRTRWATVLLLSTASIQAAGTQILHGNVPEAIAASNAVGQGRPRPLKCAWRLDCHCEIKQELDNLLKQLADPASPNFRQYLTPVQFAERFGPTEENYQALASFLAANGFSVTGTHPNRTILDVSGTVADIESTFHLNMMNWRHPARGTFFAPDREPSGGRRGHDHSGHHRPG